MMGYSPFNGPKRMQRPHRIQQSLRLLLCLASNCQSDTVLFKTQTAHSTVTDYWQMESITPCQVSLKHKQLITNPLVSFLVIRIGFNFILRIWFSFTLTQLFHYLLANFAFTTESLTRIPALLAMPMQECHALCKNASHFWYVCCKTKNNAHYHSLFQQLREYTFHFRLMGLL